MKYLLLCALLLCGAFLFQPAAISQTENDYCPLGGTYTDGKCTMPSPSVTKYIIQGYSSSGRTAQEACDNSYSSMISAWLSANSSASDPVLNSSTINLSYATCNHSFTYKLSSGNSFPGEIGAYYRVDGTFNACPPDGQSQFNQGPIAIGEQQMCYYPAEPEPQCDCANFAGDSLSTFNDLRAPVGQYTKDNPPQCIQQREYAVGRDEPLTCVCQVSAQKWTSSYGGFANGVEYEVWSTLPTTQGQPSGTFTGVKCGDKDGGPVEPEEDAPKDCFTLKNGVKWCWADPKEHCQVVNGQEQCSSGCGYVNGDFVCYEDTPVIPPREDQEPNPIDDTITDPNKSINDMIKGDFKDISRGTEQRLDNIAIAINNNQNSTNNVADAIGVTNSKLDGIGMQLDGTGKDIGAIKGILEGALTGEDGGGTPDTGAGDCTENCSWYESAYPDGLVGIWQERSAALQQTPMFEFVNQFSFQPSGSQPDMELCLNFASWANFGCHSLEIPSFVWVFLKICILFTAAMLCRALIFGG